MPANDRELNRHVANYLQQGWNVIPLRPGVKAPESENWNNQTIPAAFIDDFFKPDSNIGVNTGTRSGGLVDVDLENDLVVAAAMRLLPKTERKSGRAQARRNHWFYRCSDDVRRINFNDPNNGELLLEIRGSGHQTMVPPSIHAKYGDTLFWEDDSESKPPAEVELAELQFACGKIAVVATLVRMWPMYDSNHHAIVLHLAGGLFRSGWALDDVLEIFEVVTSLAPDEDNDDARDRANAIRSTYARWEEDKEITGWNSLAEITNWPLVRRFWEWLGIADMRSGNFPRSDEGNAQRLAHYFGDQIKFVPEFGKWIIWNQSKWKVDNSGAIMNHVRMTVEKMYEEMMNLPLEDREKFNKWIIATQALNRMNAMHKLAQSIEKVVVHADQLDTLPFHFNMASGTYDLQNRVHQPHNSEEMHTRISTVRYDPEAKAPKFRAFMERIQPEADMREFLQRAMGYTMTGSNGEQALFILNGNTANGKSTFLTLMSRLMGEYATNADIQTFLHTNSDKIRTDLARLAGARFVSSTEPDEGQRLATGLIKKITGGDAIISRKLFQEEFEHRATYKIWISTNFMPRASSSDDALWRRMKVIPFDVTIPEGERIPHYEDILWEEEKAGIMNWLIEGARMWLEKPLSIAPARVTMATQDYRVTSDNVARFVTENCEKEEGSEVGSMALFRAYQEWSEGSNERQVSQAIFREKVSKLGFEAKRKEKGVVWVNMTLTADQAPTQITIGLQDMSPTVFRSTRS